MPIYLLLFICFYIIICRSENEIDIKDAGVGFIAPNDIAMIFYITLKNNCERDYEISVSMLECCENTKPNENFCGYMYLIGGYMGVLNTKSTRNVTLIYPNLYLFNRQGVCTVAIKYQDQNAPQKITTEIEYKTTNCEDSSTQCPTPDLDPMDNCYPVDCVAKYSGGKNFYNTKARECDTNPVCISGSDTCDPQIAYSIANNDCINIHSTMNMSDLEMLEKNEVDVSECEESLSINAICHHGYMDTNGKCVCHHDWITTTDDEIYEPSLLVYHMCNIEIGAWGCINKGRIQTTALLIAVFAITIASKILILMCILNWFYRRFRRGKMGSMDIDVCTKLDEDENILLCEELIDGEKCVCEPTKNEKNLRNETVHIGFYPCAPSYSSIRISSSSERSKYALKSDQSILLSHTTSSSAPATYQSETDVTTEESEDVDDEENYEIEFSGEEEEDYLQDVVCVPEEAYGEDGKSKEYLLGEEEGEGKTESSTSPVGSRKETDGSKKETSKSSSKSKVPSMKSKASKKSSLGKM